MTRQPRPYIRSARAADKAAVLRFTEHTWDWGDYISEVWGEWLAETNGRMLVVTMQREPAAVAHVAMVGPGEAWIEGMRVESSFRRHGIATALTRRCLAEAVVMGAHGPLRYRCHQHADTQDGGKSGLPATELATTLASGRGRWAERVGAAGTCGS